MSIISNVTATTSNNINNNQSYTTKTITVDNTHAISNTYTTSATTGYSNYGTTTVSPSYWNSNYELYYNGISVKEYVKEIIEEYNKLNEKDNKKMNNNFGFGPYNTSNIRLSIYGMAIKNKAGKWVSYNKQENCLVDVEILNFEIDPSKIFYRIPKAICDIEPGDIILHNDTPMFVEGYEGNNKFGVINPYEGTAVTILPLTSPFGFNYVTQIVSITDMLPKATKDNPFGNLLPFIIGGSDNALAMMMMMGKDVSDIDPMMLMALCGKGDMSMFLLMQMMKKKDCKCEKHKTKYYDMDDTLDHRRQEEWTSTKN